LYIIARYTVASHLQHYNANYAAKAAFDFLDRNKNGKIDRKEFAAANTQFWCYLDSPDTEGMLGDKFE